MKFWFDFASTYSYPAAMRIEEVAGAARIRVEWRPFLLGPTFKLQGWNDSPFNIYPEKGRYMWRDLERICNELAIPLRLPSKFPRNGLLAARLAAWFQHDPWVPAFVRSIYQANFAYDQDISDVTVVASVLKSLNQPPSVLAVLQHAEAKEKLYQQTAEASAAGIFGAPTFSVGNELFWGNDRLEAAIAWAQRSEASVARVS